MQRDILNANQGLAKNLSVDHDISEITESMLSARKLPISERIEYYVSNRIDDQKKWYAKKSKDNKRAFFLWIVITLSTYVLALVSVNSDRLGIPWASFGFEPLVVIVTSSIGWMQMKRFSELMASYNLTALEIGIIRGNSSSIKTEEELSAFVNEAELAFSREHTQWAARRDVN